jgi:hypothetical protein
MSNVQDILKQANFKFNSIILQEDDTPTIDVAIQPLFCFFSDQMGEEVDTETLMSMTQEAMCVGVRPEEDHSVPSGTARQFVSKVNSMRIPGYDQDLTPEQNVFALDWVADKEDDYVTPEGTVPKELPGAKAIAFSSKLNPKLEDSPMIAEVMMGLPYLEDTLPSFSDAEPAVLNKAESGVIEEYLTFMLTAEPDLYQISFQAPEILMEAYPTLDPSIFYAFEFSESGPGTIFYTKGGISPENFSSLAAWLVEHNVLVPPMYCPIADLESIMVSREPFEDDEWDRLDDFDDPEMGDQGVNDFPEKEKQEPKRGRKSNSKKPRDPRLVKYSGPKWRTSMTVRGKKTVFRAALNPLSTGRQKDVKKAYPHISILLGKVNPSSVKVVVNQIGGFMAEGCDLSLPYQRAIYSFAVAAEETGAYYTLAGIGRTNAFETAVLTLLLRSDCRYWATSRDDGVIVVRGNQ